MFKLKITAKARKQLKTISKIYQQKAISVVLEEIRDNPSAGKPLTKELTGKFSYKFGIYRILYKINSKEKVVTILTAGHRGSVYG